MTLDIKLEEAIRKAEILQDSGTQKLLRSLAYVRLVRSLLTEKQGSWQFTLTHAPQSKRMQGTDGRKKKWNLRLREKGGPKSIEYGIFAECWHCNAVFRKMTYCQKCHFFVCPHCHQCGCNLKPCCREVAKKFLRAIEGKVQPLK